MLCLDHPHVQAVIPQIQRRRVTYGVSRQADCRAKNVRFSGLSTHFEAWRRGESLGDFTVKMPGHHNVMNGLSVIAVADDYGHHPAEVEATLDAAQNGFDRRVVVAFQPHRVQQGRRAHRDRRLCRRREADPWLDQRGARRGHSRARPHNVRHIADKKQIGAALIDLARPDDLVNALGAGDINASVRELLAALEKEKTP